MSLRFSRTFSIYNHYIIFFLEQLNFELSSHNNAQGIEADKLLILTGLIP